MKLKLEKINCFEAEKDREMKEKWTYGSHLEKKKNKNKRKQTEQIDRGVERVPIFYFFYSLSLFLRFAKI